MSHAIRGTCICGIIALLLTACGGTRPTVTPTQAPTQATAALTTGEFVGDAGQLAVIGLSTNGQQVIAYLCDGTDQQLTVAEWFTVPMTPTGIDVTNPNGAHLVATPSAQAITGTVMLKDGRSAPFTANKLANPGSDTGLFRSAQTVNGVSYVGGWIIHPAGGVARMPLGVPPIVASVLVSPVCCNPTGRDRGGIVNMQTGALIVSPSGSVPGSVAVPNVGTFTATACRQGQCG